jgi:Uma2 family endonuclease
MSSARVGTRSTPEQYLAFERNSLDKHEYLDGSILPMAPSNRWHNLITGSLSAELGRQLRGRPCEVYASNMRLLVSRTGLYTYPDVVAVRGAPEFQGNERHTLLNPALIIEVLSPSTEAYDRGQKFVHYRRLESLREYVLVTQDEVCVERYTRQGDEWLLSELSTLEDSLRLASIDCTISLREIYAKVEFSGESGV